MLYFFNGTICVNFVNLSVITRIKRLPALDGGSGPSKSIAIDSSGLVAGNSFIGFDFLSSRIRFFAQSVQLRTVIIISLAIDGQ